MAENSSDKTPAVNPAAVYSPILLGMSALMLTLNRSHEDGPVFTAATWWGAATGAIVALSVACVAYRRGRRRAQ